MQIINEIISWYNLNKRDLPWRHTSDPYKIWLSEIILQQTRVVQGMDYYHRFVENYPRIEDLANADEGQVLKLWQGLGYYSRARNLHSTAKTIQQDYKGKFPTSFEEIKKLKGVGDYTAAAVASFAFNMPYACVDGNVYRVLSRIFGIYTPIDSTEGKKEFFNLANELLPVKNAALYNQAMMEFGAMQCVPKSPNCSICIVKEQCVAFKTKKIDELPVKLKKTKQRKRYFYYIFLEDKKKNTLLYKRTQKDIWQHLYEFPLFEFDSDQAIEKIVRSNELALLLNQQKHTVLKVSKQYKHVLSHQLIYATFLHIKTDGLTKEKNVVSVNNIKDYAVSRLMHIYLQDNNIDE